MGESVGVDEEREVDGSEDEGWCFILLEVGRTVCLAFGGTCAKAFLAAGAYGHGPVDPKRCEMGYRDRRFCSSVIGQLRYIKFQLHEVWAV